MTFPTFEIRELKPARMIQFQGDTVNLNNVLTKTVSSGLFRKSSITLKLKTGEIITYQGVEKEEIDAIFTR